MTEWLKVASPQEIAERLDVALMACDQSSMGSIDGASYGPLISTTHFSDTIFVWSPDDSWASFAAICSAVKLIVLIALGQGVPLRGAISHGDAVCNSKTLRFVGPPIADAYNWSEHKRLYRSVGVDITPPTIEWLRSKLASDPVPDCFGSTQGGVPTQIIAGAREYSSNLIWYMDCLFVNHWEHGFFVGNNPTELFNRRGLPTDDSVREKIESMNQFFVASREMRNQYWQNLGIYRYDLEVVKSAARSGAFLALDQLRLQRER